MSNNALDVFNGPRYPLSPMIELINASFHFVNIPVLKSINLQIRPGEFTAIMGSNGSGKTTLARCLNGLLIPQKGTVSIEGKPTNNPKNLPFIRRTVGMVFQNPDDQLATTTVESELAFGLENMAVPTDEMHQRVDQALADFELAPYRKVPPHHLSGGEKQRLAIAATLIMRPRYLVLDEPTALLDPQHRRQIIELLHVLRNQYGVATILVTHVPEEAENASRIIALKEGEMLIDGSPSEVFSDLDRLRQSGLEAPFVRKLSAACHPPFIAITEQELAINWKTRPLIPFPPAPFSVATSGSGTPILESQSISHVYNPHLPHEKESLSQVSARFTKGSIHAIIGASGSGKTTFAQHLNGLLKPSAGQILLDGVELESRPASKIHQRVGIVFQFPESQLFAETVKQDVAFGPNNAGLSKERVDQLAAEALSLVDLPVESYGSRPPLSLSGGEKRRGALAGVLAMDPDVLVLDEPTAGLDPPATRSICMLLKRLAKEEKTIVLITHDIDLVALIADNTTIFNAGKVVLQGSVRSTLTHPDLEKRANLLPPTATQIALLLGMHCENRLHLPITLEELRSVLP